VNGPMVPIVAPSPRPAGTFSYGGSQQRIAAVAAAITTGASFAAIVAALLPLLYGTGVTAGGLLAALNLAGTGMPAPPSGPAGKLTAEAEATYRAAFILNAATRISRAQLVGTPALDAVTAEKRFLVLHNEAQLRRAAAAVSTGRRPPYGRALSF
jgi:hypothetical protein